MVGEGRIGQAPFPLWDVVFNVTEPSAATLEEVKSTTTRQRPSPRLDGYRLVSPCLGVRDTRRPMHRPKIHYSVNACPLPKLPLSRQEDGGPAGSSPHIDTCRRCEPRRYFGP